MALPKWTVGGVGRFWPWVLSEMDTVVSLGEPRLATPSCEPKPSCTFSRVSFRLSSTAKTVNVLLVSPELKVTLCGTPE